MKTQYKTLTERQGQYLQGVLEGKKRQTIARELGVTSKERMKEEVCLNLKTFLART